MKCRKAEQWISARRDAALEPADEMQLQLHLTACGACARHAADQKQLERWLVEPPLAEPSESFEWRLRLAISRAERDAAEAPAQPAWPRFGRHSLQFGGAALAAGLAVLVGGTWLMPDSHPVSGSTRSPVSISVPANGGGRVTPMSDGAPIGPLPAPSYSYFMQTPPAATPKDSSTAREALTTQH